MRKDVALGAVVSVVGLVAAGAYYQFRGKPEIPVGEKLAAAPAQPPEKKTSAPAGKEQAKPAKPDNPKPSGRTASPPPRSAVKPPGQDLANRPPTAGSSPPPSAAAPAESGTARGTTPPARTESTPLDARTRLELSAASPPKSDPSMVQPDADSNTGPAKSAAAPPLIMDPAKGTAQPGAGVQTPPERVDTPALRPETLSQKPADVGAGSPEVKPAIQPDTSRAATAPHVPPATGGGPSAIEHHKIQPGDTFSSLAISYYGNERFTNFLVDANSDITDPDRLRVGQVVKIPPKPADEAVIAARPTAGSTASPAGSPTPRPATTGTPAVAQAGGRSYTVRPGDSFYAIAREELGSGNRWKELFELNKKVVGGDARGLKPGQVLQMPERK